MKLSTQHYRIFLENLSAGVIVHAPDTTILYSNKKAQEFLGLSVDQIQGKTSLDVQWRFVREDGSDLPYDEYPIARVLHFHNELLDYVVGILCLDKPNTTWVSCNSNQIFHADGTLDHVLISLSDITQRKIVEEELRKSQERLQLVIKGSNDAPWDWDMAKNEVYYSPQWWKQLGYDPNEFPADAALWERLINPDDKQAVDDVFRRAFAERIDSYEVEFHLLHKDGHYVPVLSRGFITRDKTGVPVRLTGTNMDLTERKEAARLIEQSNSDLKLAQRIANIGNWSLDPEVGAPVWSSEVYRIYERDPELGPYSLSDYQNIYHGVFWERFNTAMQAALNDGLPYDIVLKLELASGRIKWVHVICEPTLPKGPQGYYIRGTIQDISEVKNAQRILTESETQLRTLVNTIPDLVWLKNKDGIFLRCNRTFERLFGTDHNEIIGKSDYDFFDKELADFFRMHDRNAMAAGHSIVNEESLTFAEDGYSGLFETIKTPMHDVDGNLLGVLGIARDISDRKAIEIALKENEQRYKSAQRMGNVGNWEYDFENETFWGSEQARRIYGFDLDVEQFTVDNVENCIPERERVHQALIDLKEKNLPYNLEFEIRPVTGPSSKIIRSTAEIVRDEKGKPLKVLGVIQDITSLKQTEKDRIKLIEQLKQSQKMESIGNLAGGIAHDFNNILTSILGFTELALAEAVPGGTLEDSLQEIYSSGKRARDLVKQILAFARLSKEERKPVQVAILVKEVLKLIRSTIPATIEIKEDLRSCSLILGNESQLHQLFMNLCTNAAQAMEDTGGEMHVILNDSTIEDQPLLVKLGLPVGDYLKITVSDTGPGISAEIIDSIFEPYFTTKRLGSDKGTGMGLALVHGIIESCGGKVSVESVVGKGAVFTVFLPISKRQEEPQSTESESPSPGTEHILFVDDEIPIARMGCRMLESLGYTVTTKNSGFEALELFKLKADEIDLVFTDMTMPSMTGDDLSVELRRIRKDIPIILCTGYSNKMSEDRARKLGINAFVYKPFTKSDFAKTIREVLEANRLSSA